jgi:hypothetical protein
MGKKRNAYRILVGKPKERDHWEDQDIGGWGKPEGKRPLGRP